MLTLIYLGVAKQSPLVYFLYNFLVTYLNFLKFGGFSWNLSGINILDLF